MIKKELIKKDLIEKNKWNLLLSSLVILLPILFGLIFWNRLPEQIATHWNVNGVADGWSNRPFAVLALPGFLLITHWFCILASTMDPRNKNQNNKIFSILLWICPIVSLFTGFMIYATALGKQPDSYLMIALLLGMIFIMIGNYLPKCKQNSTIGIRIKWTLEHEENWNATHRFCGKLWVIGGILTMACAFLPKTIATAALFLFMLILVILPIAYSYKYKIKKQEN